MVEAVESMSARDKLLYRVFDQMEKDINERDFTAIEELLASVSDEQLIGYLPEGE